MSKFNHEFKTAEKGEKYAVYQCDKNVARIDFISSSAFRVAIYKNVEELLPSFSVCPDNAPFSRNGRDRLSVKGFEGFAPSYSDEGNKDVFTFGENVVLKVEKHNFLLSLYKDEQLLFADRTPLAYNFENEFGDGSFHYLSRDDGERIFGLGDKGGELDKAGRSFRFETTDCMGYDAKNSDPLYKHIPFYICENSIGIYAIFYDTTETSYIDFGKEINNYYQHYKYFSSKDNALVYYVFTGTKLSVLKQFASICAKQPFPPKWSFDYCASTMAYTDAERSQEKMHDFIETLKKYDFSCGGFYLSSGYTSIADRRYVFNWNKEKFPDVKAFVEEFSQNGIELIPNIKPAFLVDHPLYEELKQKGLFVKNPDSTPFITEFWDGFGSYLDFTNEEAFDFWKSKVKETLLDNNITATWNDNNEFDIKDTDAVSCGFSKKVKANRIRSVLTYLMVASSYQAQTQLNPQLRPFLSTRSGGVGVRRFAQTWSGDNRSEFSDLRYCHNIGLTMSLSSLFFYGHDLGGFSGDMPSRELLLRWIQHGIFEPRLTIHSWNSDGSATMPWSYEDIVVSVRNLFAQRKRLLPYLYTCAYNSVENDEPINAPLFLYYDDEKLYSNTDSMLVGKDVLVYFVFDEGKQTIDAYLPKGDDWYLGNVLYKGGETVKLTVSMTDQMPYFVKSGCVLATDEAQYGFNCKEDVVFYVYPKQSGIFESEFFNDDGKSFEYLNGNCTKLKFFVKCTEKEIVVSYQNLGGNKIDPVIKMGVDDSRTLKIERADD